MKVIAYLGFTLLSILIQFCVMDLTKEKTEVEDEQVYRNVTSNKKRFQDLIKDITQKPHALYFRTHVNKDQKDINLMASTKTYSNTTMQRIEISTVISSTILDELYDENMSTTEDTFTTESLYTSTEIDNITEISFFDNKNQSVLKSVTPKKFNKDCGCNLLYNVCDINCCCDNDCSEAEKEIFLHCKDAYKKNYPNPHMCYPYEYFSYQENNFVDNLFCIIKTNLPEKRNKDLKKYDIGAVAHSYKWHNEVKSKHTEFQKQPYMYGKPVWVLKDGSIWYIDTPSPTINNYCTGRKPILFLKNENIKCIVSFKDLEMFKIINTPQEAPCISVTEKSLNTTALNCSTLHCTNWTVIVCDEIKCVDYNKSVHEPSCTETTCTNLALKLEYVFYYHDAKIINATIKLFSQNISLDVPFMNQEVNVRFVLSNESIENIIEFSGNPGYVYGRPVISTTAPSNRSLNFFNVTSPYRKYLVHPINKHGICTSSNTENNLIMFGLNKRIKCRYVYNKNIHSQNGTNICNDIEGSLEQELLLNNKFYVSPYGNPVDVKDNDWVPIQTDLLKKDVTYGQFVAKNSKLRCYNVITSISYIFTFADVSLVTTKRDNKIISVNINVSAKNVTFTAEDMSTVLTVDTNFIDGTKRVYEYAAGPHINIYLPKDFFFPFPSNGFHVTKQSSNLILICYVMYFQIK